MAKTSWNYSWGNWEANIKAHPRRKNSYQWSVNDVNGNDTYDMYSDIDAELETPLEAERDMFRQIDSRIGHTPKKQIG